MAIEILLTDIVETASGIAVNSGLFLLLFLMVYQLRSELRATYKNIPSIVILIFGLVAITSIFIITNIFLYFWVVDMEILILG